MKILKRLALSNIVVSGSISHYYFFDLAYKNTLLSFCMRKLEKLANRINTYLLTYKKVNSIKLEWNLNHSHHRMKNIVSVPIKNSQITDWAPLIKASSAKKRNSYDVVNNKFHLAGQTILCVGGRFKLYPEYRQSIENYRGKLATFHSNQSDHLHYLLQLLEEADMVICPVDCINHEAFFIVKYYCKYSGKPCVLLDRSEVSTFHDGINKLVNLIE